MEEAKDWVESILGYTGEEQAYRDSGGSGQEIASLLRNA